MPTYKYCRLHGDYLGDTCPKCKPEPSKKSKKYGGVVIHVPPNMRSVSK